MFTLGVKNTLQGAVFYSDYVGSRDQTQVTRLSNKHFYPRGHLANMTLQFLILGRPLDWLSSRNHGKSNGVPY